MHHFNFLEINLIAGLLIKNANTKRDTDKGIDMLLTHLQQYPFGLGAADASHLLGIAHMSTEDWHRAEICFLIAYYLRTTRIQPYIHFDCLVNLSKCCNELKAFQEAYDYGMLAYQLFQDDLDLIFNIAVASFFLKKADFNKWFILLKNNSHSRINELMDLINEWEIVIEREKNHDLEADLNRHFSRFFKSKNHKILVEYLNLHPICKNSSKWWAWLAKLNNDQLRGTSNKFIQIQIIASQGTAASKALNSFDSSHSSDKALYMWRIMSMFELGCGDVVNDSVYTVTTLFPEDHQVLEALNYYRSLSYKTEVDRYFERVNKFFVRQPGEYFSSPISGLTVCNNIVVINALNESELNKIIEFLEPVLLEPFWAQPSFESYKKRHDNEIEMLKLAGIKFGQSQIKIEIISQEAKSFNCLVGPDKIKFDAWVFNSLGRERINYSPKAAIELFENALKVNRFYFDALVGIGESYIMCNDKNNAILWYNIALLVNHSSPKIRTSFSSLASTFGVSFMPDGCPRCKENNYIYFLYSPQKNYVGWACGNCNWNS